MTIEKLTEAQRADLLAGLQGWTVLEGRDAIRKTFIFSDFVEAFGWMTKIAMLAEKLDHHPEWHNVYKTVEVTLTTHDADGLTERDATLAKAMDRLTAR
ncbi:MAG: 4a-hydroxytetrahydrobiopterin dehydratase [Microvirga sp.]|nr:4a-hydroxytetrahydrobiopterin dehydratase [Microvirga sp.]